VCKAQHTISSVARLRAFGARHARVGFQPGVRNRRLWCRGATAPAAASGPPAARFADALLLFANRGESSLRSRAAPELAEESHVPLAAITVNDVGQARGNTGEADLAVDFRAGFGAGDSGARTRPRVAGSILSQVGE